MMLPSYKPSSAPGLMSLNFPCSNPPPTEMEYCASAMSMLAEEFWQIAEEFVEVPANLYAQLKKCG